MNKTPRCCARTALSQRCTHSHPAPRQARTAPLRCYDGLRSNTLLIGWTLGKCPQMLERARHLHPLSSLFYCIRMNKTPRCCARTALSQRCTHSHPAPRQARTAPLRCYDGLRSNTLLIGWTLGKCPQMLERARHLHPLSSLFYSYYTMI